MSHSVKQRPGRSPTAQNHHDQSRAVAGSSKPRPVYKQPSFDPAEHLQQLQQVELSSIIRSESDRKKSKLLPETTSTRDLEIARRPQQFQPRTEPHATTIPYIEEDDEAREDVAAPQQQIKPIVDSKSNWANKADMRAEPVERDSNAWDSDIPSNGTRDSRASAHSFGRLLNRQSVHVDDTALADWEGNWAPVPADWAERDPYNNNNELYKSSFKAWLSNIADVLPSKFSSGVPIPNIAPLQLYDGNLIPDGIQLVHRHTVVNSSNAENYGYVDNPEENLFKYTQGISADEFDDDCCLDLNDHDNVKHKDERPEQLIQNWLGHRKRTTTVAAKNERQIQRQASPTSSWTTPPAQEMEVPKLNIYMRPATTNDLPELTRIYNKHILEGSRPSETAPITENEMQNRLEVCQDGRLPFIVAALQNQKHAPPRDSRSTIAVPGHTNHAPHQTLSNIEQLAGFCCAQDYSAADYVDHISAEIELYVDPAHWREGVGKCLVDKMLEILDPSHLRRTKCQFHCARDLRHMYGPGGQRKVLKSYFIIREWATPRPAAFNLEEKRRHRKQAFKKTHEGEYKLWLQPWLQKLGFVEEGHLTRNAAKYGRYIDTFYQGRETSWQPEEGHVPDPDPRDIVNYADDSDS